MAAPAAAPAPATRTHALPGTCLTITLPGTPKIEKTPLPALPEGLDTLTLTGDDGQLKAEWIQLSPDNALIPAGLSEREVIDFRFEMFAKTGELLGKRRRLVDSKDLSLGPYNARELTWAEEDPAAPYSTAVERMYLGDGWKVVFMAAPADSAYARALATVAHDDQCAAKEGG